MLLLQVNMIKALLLFGQLNYAYGKALAGTGVVDA
jgi:hypothetical protein